MSRLRRTVICSAVLGSAIALAVPASASSHSSATGVTTTTPIKHVVVIFQENVSFDHYFGTYPKATNTSGVPFHAAAFGTPKVNGLKSPGAGGTGTLLTNNPNTDALGNQVNPRRLNPAHINDVLTCDQGHNYNAEQKAFNGGKMDEFVTTVGTARARTGPANPVRPPMS